MSKLDFDGKINQDLKDLDIDFSSPEYLACPWPLLQRIADCAPVYWSANQRAWIITRHADVKAAHLDRRLSAARVEMYLKSIADIAPDAETLYPTGFKFIRLQFAFFDGAEHRRIRALMLKAFNGKAVERMRGNAIDVTEELLDEAENDREFDFIKKFSQRMPTRVIQALLGVRDSNPPEFFNLADATQSVLAGAKPTRRQLEAFESAARRLNEIFGELISERRRSPADDLLSELVHARDNLEQLSDEELLAACGTIISAGSDTTGFMLASAVYEIAQNPELLKLLRSEPGSEKAIVQELLRFPGLVRGEHRLAAEDFILHGQQIRQGDLVFMMNSAANIDPAVFPDPTSINPKRPARQLQESMAFGPGIHSCVGHLIARMELEEALVRIFSRFDVEILDNDIQYVDSYVLRGFKQLRVRFSPIGRNIL